jgi:glycerate kinase
LHGKLARCNLCLTAEGRIDDQTVGGKVVAGVARRAVQCGTPAWAFTGAVRMKPGQTLEDLARAVGMERIIIISPPEMLLPEALAATTANLRRAAREAMAAYS